MLIEYIFFLDEAISKAYISRLEQNYYLISKNAVAIKRKQVKTVEQLVQEVGNARENLLISSWKDENPSFGLFDSSYDSIVAVYQVVGSA